MADSTPKSYHSDPTLYLYTSLTAGSSQIITATSRLETILKANRIQFEALDVATDEKARMLWGRRAGKKKLPGLVRMGMIVADLAEVEEWNEYGEIKDNLSFATTTQPSSTTSTPSKPPPTASISTPAASSPLKTTTNTFTTEPTPSSPSQLPTPATPASASKENSMAEQMRQLGLEAAQKASDAKSKARADASGPSNAKSETLQKLDNAGPTGMPPPSGTTEAKAAKAPETINANIASRADETPVVVESGQSEQEEEVLEGEGEIEDAEMKHTHGTTKPLVASVGQKEDEGEDRTIAKALEEHGGLEPSKSEQQKKAEIKNLDDKGEEDPKGPESKIKDATSLTEELPGKKTQDQAAARPDEAGVSVGD